MKNTLKGGLIGAFLAIIVLSLVLGLLPSLSGSAVVSGADGFTNRLRATTPADALTPAAPVETLNFDLRYNGATWDRLRAPNTFKTVALTAATTETTIWTPASGKKFRLMGFILTPGAATSLTFKDNTSGTTIFV